MIYYDIIDVSEGIGINKTSQSKECGICHYWYFFNKGFKLRANVCNRCHDLLMMSMNFIVILNIKSAGYCCSSSRICKSAAINIMQNTYLTKISRTL